MPSPRLKHLALLLMLASASVLLVAGSPLVAGALALGVNRAHAHGHAIALVSDAGHVDLVLSHAGSDARHEAEGRPDGNPAFSHGDHVLHIDGDDSTQATPRRSVPAGSALLLAVTMPPVAPPAWLLHSSPERRSGSFDHLKTVILRL